MMTVAAPLRFAVLGALAGSIALATGASFAAQGSTRNGMNAAGDAARFEVFPGRAAGGADLFCAAGDFARVHLGARATDRVELVGAPAPSLTRPGQRSVVFALRPQSAARPTGLDTVLLRPRAEGNSRSVAFAANLCNSIERR